VILLISIGFLSYFINKNLSVKDAMRLIAKNPLIILITLAVRCPVVYSSMMIHNLLIADDGDAIHKRVNILAVVNEIQVVTNQFTPKGKCIYRSKAVTFLFSKCVVYQISVRTVVLNLVPVCLCILIGKDFGYGIGEYKCIIKIVMALDHFNF